MYKLNKLLQIVALLLVLTFTAAAQERNWKYFSPQSGEWTIFAPGEMSSGGAEVENLGRRGGFSYAEPSGFFAVVYEESASWKVSLMKPFIGSHYKKIRKGFVKNSKGTLIKDVKFKHNNFSGREFYVKIPDGKILDGENQLQTRYRVGRFRVFFQGNRCYMLLAVLPEKEINSFAIDNYFNSFVAK